MRLSVFLEYCFGARSRSLSLSLSRSLVGEGLDMKVRLNQLSRRPVFSPLPNRPILLANCVSGVPASLSTCGVFGVSPPELKSMSRDGVRICQGLGCTCAGTEDAGVAGNGLVGSRL